MSFPASPYLLALGAWELLDNARINVLERMGLARCPSGQLDLRGQVYMVTGGNAGVGKATVQELAQRGAHVIIAARSVQRGNAAMQEIQAACRAAGIPASLEVLQLDLGDLHSVRSFAAQLNKRFKPRQAPLPSTIDQKNTTKNTTKNIRNAATSTTSAPCTPVPTDGLAPLHTSSSAPVHLDCLICNAGLMAPPSRQVTRDGLEEQFQVNYLSHWFLASQLLSAQRRARKKLSSSPQAPGVRIVMVSSMTHYGGHLDWQDLQHAARYVPFQAYADSKLMNVMAARELHRRCAAGGGGGGGGDTRNAARYPAPQDSGVSVHPGLVDTALARGYFLQLLPGVLQPLLKPLFPVILRTPASAAKTVVYAATAPEVAGQYVSDGRVHPPSKRAQDVGAACRLWDVSTVLVGWETPPELAE